MEMAVYDVRGRQVAVLNSGIETAGHHQMNWQTGDLASGVYLLRRGSSISLMPQDSIAGYG